MEEAQVRFGDITSADVKLVLKGPNNENYERNPVHLHSVILQRSEYFRAKMTERWPLGTPCEIMETTTCNFDVYLKCIKLMYVESVCSSNVEECLVILSVASDLFCDDCINKCMQYLEAVHWSEEEESQIRIVLASLRLKPLPDLEARLDKEDGDNITFLEKIITNMVALTKGKQDSVTNRGTAEKYIADIYEGNACRDDVEVFERVVLEQFKSSICSHSFESIASLFKLIERCDREILKGAFIAFCEDPRFWEDVDHAYTRREFCEDVFYIIIWFMKAIGDVKIIISRASRVSFLTTWLPIMGGFCSGIGEHKLGEFNTATLNIIESLPLVDRKSICVVWLKAYSDWNIDITTPFSLFKDLCDAHYESTSMQE